MEDVEGMNEMLVSVCHPIKDVSTLEPLAFLFSLLLPLTQIQIPGRDKASLHFLVFFDVAAVWPTLTKCSSVLDVVK